MMPTACSKRSGRSCPRVARLALATTAVLAALAALPQQASALPRVQPYVQLSVTPQSLDLGTVPQPGTFDSPSELKVHVAANCVHGGIAASVTALQRTGGGSIGPERVFMKLPATGNYVPMTHPVAVTGPMTPGVFDVILKFRVETALADIPGEYAGTLTITLVPQP